MTDFLPLFPLKMVVFPGEKLNLHIFEPRYKQLIREAEQNGTTFGIPAFIDNKIMNCGTEISLLSVEKRYENGEMDIKTEGIGLFEIKQYYKVAPNKLYAGADIQRIQQVPHSDHTLSIEIVERVKELFRILKIKKKLPESKGQFSTFKIAHHVGLSLEQEYQFLCLSTEFDRQNFIFDHLEQLIPIVREMERLRKRVQLNGHFKNVIPPTE